MVSAPRVEVSGSIPCFLTKSRRDMSRYSVIKTWAVRFKNYGLWRKGESLFKLPTYQPFSLPLKIFQKCITTCLDIRLLLGFYFCKCFGFETSSHRLKCKTDFPEFLETAEILIGVILWTHWKHQIIFIEIWSSQISQDFTANVRKKSGK